MIKKLNLILILFVLIFVSLGAVSASEDANDTVSINEVDITDINEGGEIQASSSNVVTPSNYGSYFSSSGELSSAVSDGDTLTFTGEFSSKNFIITKNITIIGSGATIKNGVITIKSGGSGSEISNLNIINTEDYLQGFFLDGASGCYIHDNFINNTGVSSYPVCLNTASNYNTIANNTLQTNGATYGHGTRSTSLIVLGGADNNYIAENTLYCSDANAIYLSSYGNGGSFKGGISYNNIIYKNEITYIVDPTSWAYAIQMMGGNNTADSNVINGAYRGISSSNLPGNKAINNIISITGKDFSTNASTGGDYGIALATDSLIKNNTITGVFVGAGISAGDNSVIENNFINSSKSYGVVAEGDDVVVRNNTIYTASSADIYQQGLYSGIVVDNNRLFSDSGIGVLLKKASKTKYPSNITITNNQITTSNDYIINAADADKDSYTITANTGNGKILTPAGEVDPSVPDFVYNGTTHYITPDNYHNFIDSDGNLMSDYVSDGDILSFKGEFSNKEILLTKSVKVTGDAPVFLNSTFIVTSDAVWIENVTVINQYAPRYNAWAIFVADTQSVKIVNNELYVFDPAAAYAIYIYQSSKVYVENNSLFSSGDSLTYTLLGYGAENCEFTGNIIDCRGTGELHQFENTKSINGNTSEVCIGHCLGDVLKEHCLDGTNIIPEIYRTYGILMIKSSNNSLDSNEVHVTSDVEEPLAVNSTNSLVGIDFYYDCDNNLVSNNQIDVNGNDNYLYGAGALAQSTGQFSTSTAKNNTFANNYIRVMGCNVVEGLIFGQGCEENVIRDNYVEVTTERTAYGITLEDSDKSVIEDNEIVFTSGIGYGIEAYSSNGNVIMGNNISGVGRNISGIAGINMNDNIIVDNVINSSGDGSDLGFKMHDVIRSPNSGISVDGNSTGNIIDSNSITTMNGYPVDLSEESSSNEVTNNFLKGGIASGDEGVNNSEGNLVENNYYMFLGQFEMANMAVPYMGNAVITVKGDKSDDGAVVVFKIADDVIGNATLNGGSASISYPLASKYAVGNYTVTASISKAGYKSVDVDAQLEVAKANITINVADVYAKIGQTVPFTANVTDLNGNPLASREVKFYRNAQYIGAATTDKNGVATANLKIPAGLLEDTYTILAIVSESGNYLQGAGEATLFMGKTATKIIVNNIVMNCRDGTRLYATLNDVNGTALTGKTVTISINGASYAKTTDEKGQVSLGLNLSPGNFTTTVSFAGDVDYASSSATANVTIKPTLFGGDITMMYKNGTRYYVSVMKDGKAVAGENISLNINGVIYHRTTDEKGSASIAINLRPNTYIVTAELDSTKERISNTLVVKSILADDKNMEMYYKNGSSYSVKVLKNDGSVAGAGEVVRFNINGVFYNKATDENGIASLRINLAPSDYIITAEYKGCQVSNTIKVLPVLKAQDLTKKRLEKKSFEVNLVDGHGNPLADAHVIFNINGVFYNKTTDANGVASLAINLNVGKYIITSSYNGANIANDVTVTEG